MDKIKQNIDLQEAIQRYNIEKSVVGTLAYNIDQNIQKGMSVDEAIDDVLQKSKSYPIGTIHNGFKKIAEGKWRKVQKQHENSSEDRFKDIRNKIKDNNGTFSLLPTSEYPISSQLQALTGDTYNMQDFHNVSDASKLSANEGNIIVHKKTGKLFKMPESDKDYSDEEVGLGGEKKEEGYDSTFELNGKIYNTKGFTSVDAANKFMEDNKGYGLIGIKKQQVLGKNEEFYHVAKNSDKGVNKSQPESTLSKAEQTKAQKTKIKRVMDEWKAGKLKSSSGEVVKDQKMALAIALSEVGISKED